jgi:hypothetical protein
MIGHIKRLLLAGALMLGAAACGDDDDTGTDPVVPAADAGTGGTLDARPADARPTDARPGDGGT